MFVKLITHELLSNSEAYTILPVSIDKQLKSYLASAGMFHHIHITHLHIFFFEEGLDAGGPTRG